MANPPLSTPAEIAAANQQRQNAFLSSGYYDPNVPLSMQGPNSSFNNSPTDVSNQLSGYGNGQINWNPTNYIAGSEFGQSTPAHNAASGFQTGESGNAFGNFLDVAVPIILAAGTAAITGGAGAALGGAAIGGAAGTAIGTGAGAAAGTAVNDYGNSRPVTGGQLATSFLGGAAGSLASPLSSALSSSTGLNSAVSSGLVKGAIGAGTGALQADLNGGNVENAALTSGISSGVGGALQGSGILGTATSALSSAGLPSSLASSLVNAGTGIIAGGLLSKYLGSGSSSAAPTTSAAAPATATAPAKSGATVVQPTAPSSGATPAAAAPTAATPSQSGATVVSPQPTPTTGTAPANIGSYAGLGYQPMQQVNAGITNYNTYGQGPEASFFAPVQPGT